MNDKNQLPQPHETIYAIMKTLSDHGELKRAELITKVEEEHYAHIPKEIRKEPIGKNQWPAIKIKINFGILLLVLGKFIKLSVDTRRFEITEKGKKAITSGSFTFQDLKNDRDFQDYKKREKERKYREGISDASTEEYNEEQKPSIENIEKAFEVHKSELTEQILDRLSEVKPEQFGKIVMKLFRAMDYGDIKTTQQSHDEGIDGIITQDKLGFEKIYVRAKQYKLDTKIREKEIRGFIGSLDAGVEKGIFVTTSEFDENAKKRAGDATKNIRLIDGIELTELMFEYNCGIQATDTYKVKAIDSDFFDDEEI